MAFAQLGQESSAKERQRCRRTDTEQQRQPDERARMAAGGFEPPAVAFAQPAHVPRFLVGRYLGKEQVTQRRGDRERHAQRSEGGQNEGDAQRRKEPALHSAHGQDRHKNHGDDEGGIHDGAPDFERGLEHHAE